MKPHYDVLLLTPTVTESARRRLLPDTVGQRDHLGLGYLASCIEQLGGRALILDCLAEKICPADLAGELSEITFSLAGVYAYQQHAGDVERTVELLRSRNQEAPILLGGNDATLASAQWLDGCPAISGVLRGEGEAVVPHLIEVAAGARELADVPGMSVRGKVTPPVDPPEIDGLPWPVRPSLARGARECSIVTTRGCAYRCEFCAVPEFRRHGALPALRARSPESVVDELDYLVRGRGIEYVSFVDDLFFGTGPRGLARSHRLVEAIERSGLHFEFGITCRTDDVEPELFALLRHAGLRTVYFGVESLIDEELSRFSKDNNAQTNLDALRTCRSLGLEVHVGFLMLHPEVTLELLEANVRALHRHGLWEYALKHRLLTRRMYIFRGTPAARRYGAAEGFDYAYPDPRIAGYLERARRLEHQAFFMVLQPEELRRARTKGQIPTRTVRRTSVHLPPEFLAASYALLDHWFESVRAEGGL